MGEIAFELDKVTTAETGVEEVSIEARLGEILGIGGLVGRGKVRWAVLRLVS